MAGSLPNWLSALFVCAGLASYATGAQACQCARLKDLSAAEWEAKLFDKAKNVVRGKFVAMNAGRDVARDGQRYVVGQFVVEEVLKSSPESRSQISTGNRIEILTGFGDGDCSVPHLLLYSIGADAPVEIEILSSADGAAIYGASSCAYSKIP